MAFGFEENQTQFILSGCCSKIGMAFGFEWKTKTNLFSTMFFSKRGIALGFLDNICQSIFKCSFPREEFHWGSLDKAYQFILSGFFSKRGIAPGFLDNAIQSIFEGNCSNRGIAQDI